MGKFQNSTPPRIILSQPNFLWKFPVTVLTKITYCEFEISIFFFFEIFVNIGHNGRENFWNATAPTVLIWSFFNRTFAECSLWQSLQKLLVAIVKI